jgi:hypothetical protein
VTAIRTPWLARQSTPAGPPALLTIACVQAGTAPTGSPAALTAPLDRIQASGWPARLPVVSLKLPRASSLNVMPRLIATVVWLAGNRLGRIHSGMAIWTAAKTTSVTAMAGTVRWISAPAVTPRVKASAA